LAYDKNIPIRIRIVYLAHIILQ